MADQELIDTQVLDNLKELLGEGYDHLISTFLSDATERMAQLKQAIESGDIAEMANQSHALKGSCRNLGIIPMSTNCEQIETNARQGELADSAQIFSAVEQQFAAVRSFLAN